MNNRPTYYEDEADRQYYKRTIEKALDEAKSFCVNFKCSKNDFSESCPLYDCDTQTCAVDLLEQWLYHFQTKEDK